MTTLPPLPKGLLDGSARQEAAAWAHFVAAVAPVIWAQVRGCFARYGAPQTLLDMEDVSQDVFVRLTRSDYALLRRFDPARAQLSTYLGVIAHSACVDFLRKRRVAHEDIDAPGLNLAAAPPPCQADTGAVLALLPANLLSDRQRFILSRLFDEDMDVLQVARLLNVEAQTVRSAKHKALTKIRKHFDENPHLRAAA